MAHPPQEAMIHSCLLPSKPRLVRRPKGVPALQTIRDNLATIIAGAIVAALVFLSFVVFAPWRLSHDATLRAIVHDGDGNVQELPLSQDARVRIATSLGSNTIVVENGAVRVEQADCPGGDCMRQQPISQAGQQLICLPHKLWVEVAGHGATTGTMDVDAVVWDDATNDVDLVAR